ncbi:MAG: tetratricopeptide repeat protein [Saprospiraceae bacterium]|nr:tetratricopeptide repeat protein [Saprospiraceae bacterium]
MLSHLGFGQIAHSSKINNSEWYGEISFDDSSIMLIKISFEEVGANSGKAILYYPEYNNSALSLDYSVKNGEVVLTNPLLIQGSPLNEDAIQKLTFQSNHLLGDYFRNGKPIGRVKMQSTPPDGFQSIQKEAEEKYGVLKYYSTLDSLEGIRVIEQVDAQYRSVFGKEYFQSFGTVDFFGISGTMRSYSNNNNAYLKIELPFLSTVQVQTDTLGWEYSSETKTTLINRSPEDIENIRLSEMSRILDGGGSLQEVKDATYNGIECYSIELHHDVVSLYVVDKEEFKVLFNDDDGEVVIYSDFQKINDYPYPMKWDFISSEYSGSFNLDSISFEQFDESIYSIPKEYSLKIVEQTQQFSAEDFYERGEELFDKEEYTESIENYTEAIKLEPRQGKYYYSRGVSKQLSEDYYSAISDYEKAIELNYYKANCYNRLGVCMYQLGDNKNAVENYKKAIALDSSKSIYFSNICHALNREQKFEETLVYLDKLADFQTDSTVYYAKGALLTELGRYEEAYAAFEESINSGYANALVYNYYGVANYRNNDFENAIKKYEKANLLEDSVMLYTENLAYAYYQNENYELATHMFQKALEIGEDVQGASFYSSYSLSLRNLGQYDQALEQIDKALSLENQNAEFYDVKGLVLHDQGLYASAVENYTRSIGIYPDDPKPYYWRGLANEAALNMYDACQDYKKAVELGSEEAEERMSDSCKEFGLGKPLDN